MGTTLTPPGPENHMLGMVLWPGPARTKKNFGGNKGFSPRTLALLLLVERERALSADR